MGVIPKDWQGSTIGTIASPKRNSIVGGPFGSDLVSKDYVPSGVPVIRGQNMNGQWVSGDFVFVTPTKARALEANLAHPEDVIFTQRGSLGQVSLVPAKPYGAYLLSQSQMKLSVNPTVADPLFVFYSFTSYEQQKSIEDSTIQTGVPHINLAILREMAVPLPPLPEQRAIAAVLSDVDELIGLLEALIAKKRAIKQAAMQGLLTGRTRVPGLGGEWEDGQLGTIAKMVSGGTPSTSVAAYWSGRIPWITGADILGQSVANIRRHITEEAVEGSPTSIVAKGNLLVVSRTGVGKLAIAPFDVAISQDFTGVVPNRDKLSARFLFRYLDFCQHVLTNQNQGTSIKGITRDALAEVLVPLPPLPEQRAIAAILSDMDSEIAALEHRLDKTRAIKQGMMQQLLTGSIRLPIPDDDTEDDEAHDA